MRTCAKLNIPQVINTDTSLGATCMTAVSAFINTAPSSSLLLLLLLLLLVLVLLLLLQSNLALS